MKRALISLFPLAMLLTVLAAPAAADPLTWTITNVSLSDGGSVQGWFTYDPSQANPITDWSFTAELGSGYPSPPVPIQNPYTFLPANSIAGLILQYGQPIFLTAETPLDFTQKGIQVHYEIDLFTTNPFYDGVHNPLLQTAPIPILTTSRAFTIQEDDVNPVNRSFLTLWDAHNLFETADLTTTVPEPCILLLLGPLLAGLLGCGWKYKCI